MKIRKTAFMILFLVLGWADLQQKEASAADPDAFRAIVAYVIDGDTFQVRMRKKMRTIRLWGIDTPEMNQPHSREAKEYLKKTILKEPVNIVPYYYDDYGRIVAQVYYNGSDVNERMIELGHAWVHIYYCKKAICSEWRKKQRDARHKKRGLWQEDSPIPPWKWKRMRKS